MIAPVVGATAPYVYIGVIGTAVATAAVYLAYRLLRSF